MWAYPTEFKSKKDAGQVTDSPYRFTRVGWYSPMLYLTLGYAVFDDPTMPIIGEGEVEPNDTFIEQLVMSAQAAVDVVVAKGVGDRDRMAIGGHSYGAFMAANFPATAAAMEGMPAAMERFTAFVGVFANNLDNYMTIQPVAFVPIVWALIIGGAIMILAGGYCIATKP